MKNNISIITITRNDLEGLKKTVESIIPHLNKIDLYVVIDGLSCDGTKDYLKLITKDYNNFIYLSEKDKGIYDAMLKGAKLINNENCYLWWINSGDTLINLPYISGDYDCYFYGVKIYETKKYKNAYLKNEFTIKGFFPGSIYWHQGFIIRKKIFDVFKYDLRLNLRGDLLLMSLCHKYASFKKIDAHPCEYSISGVSNIGSLNLLREYFLTSKLLGFNPFFIFIFHPVFIAKQLLKTFLHYKKESKWL